MPARSTTRRHATGRDPGNAAVVSNDDSTSTPTDQLASLDFTKTAGTPVDVNGDGLVDAGDTIACSFSVTNTGTVTVHAVTVLDPLLGAATCDASRRWPPARRRRVRPTRPT